MAFAARKDGTTLVASTGLGANDYSTDGETWQKMKGFAFGPQDVTLVPGTNTMVAMSADGPCFGVDGKYSCKNVPFKNPGTGRYVAAPSADVVFVTAGMWPTETPAEGTRQFSKHVSLFGARLVDAPNADDDQPAAGNYSAEVWKTTDGGDTWTNLLYSEGEIPRGQLSVGPASPKSTQQPRRRRPVPRNIHVAAAAAPRLVPRNIERVSTFGVPAQASSTPTTSTASTRRTASSWARATPTARRRARACTSRPTGPRST